MVYTKMNFLSFAEFCKKKNRMQFDWLDRKEYPFSENYFSVPGGQMHYVDEGSGDPVVFIHGTPSWSFDFRNQIKILSQKYRCIAPDHIGFGLSTKSEDYDYSTMNHVRTLNSFIHHLNPGRFHLVVHDFGGPIGLGYALDHPEMIKSITVINTWLWNCEEDPEFLRFSKILKSPLLPILYKYLNFSPRYLLPNSFGNKKLSSSLRAQYTGPFKKINERKGTLAFAQSLLKDQNWFEELWSRADSIRSLPSMFIWGMKDKFVKPHYLEKFLKKFNPTKVVQLNDCGHFPQEEEAEKVSQALLEFYAKL